MEVGESKTLNKIMCSLEGGEAGAICRVHSGCPKAGVDVMVEAAGSCTLQIPGDCSVPTVWLTYGSFSLFLPSLYISALLVSGWGDTKYVLHAVHPKAGEASRSQLSLFRRQQVFLAVLFILRAEQLAWGCDAAGKMKLFVLLCAIMFRSGVPLCCWSFLSGLLSYPRAIFLLKNLSNCWLLSGDGGWGPLLFHISDMTLS